MDSAGRRRAFHGTTSRLFCPSLGHFLLHYFDLVRVSQFAFDTKKFIHCLLLSVPNNLSGFFLIFF